jgi:VWFA-related protein
MDTVVCPLAILRYRHLARTEEAMVIQRRLSALLFFAILPFPALTVAQQTGPAIESANESGSKVYLDVIVSPRSGPPVAGLQQQDFTVFDNKSQRPITSFQALGGKEPPIEVILLVDAVNTSYINLSSARNEIEKFLRANGGHLAQPMTLAIFTDKGTQIQEGSSTDGNALSDDLDKSEIGLRTISRSTGIYGADERLQLSLTALRQLAAREATRPGRKIILWVSPGWPLLSGPNIEISSKQRQQIFSTIVNVSTQLRQARVTVYSIDPLGTNESLLHSSYYEEYVKGVTKPDQANIGDLALQVIATQTGGLALNSSNDVSGLLQRAMADTSAYYELSFDPPPADHRDEYHHIEVHVAKPGLTARSLQGYYAEP